MNNLWITTIFLIFLLVGTLAILLPRTAVDIESPLLDNVSCPIEEIGFYSISKYSPEETCPNKPCIMASGRYVYIGAIACPPDIRLGIKVEILGEIFTCEDRTASWVQNKFGPTYDIFTWDYNAAKKWGRQKLLIRRLE